MPDGTRIKLRLESGIWAGNAYVGQIVMLSTEQSVKLKNGTVIPKGAIVTAHITDVRAYDTKHLDSRLSLVVTSVRWNEGELPLNAYVVGDISLQENYRPGPNVVSGTPEFGRQFFPGCVPNKYSPNLQGNLRIAKLYLVRDPNPDINSVFTCERSDVALPRGTTFTVSQVNW